MAANNSSNNGFLYFIVGALCVAVIGTGIYYFGGYAKHDQADFSVTVGDKGIDVDTN